jgi:hypothetical protein
MVDEVMKPGKELNGEWGRTATVGTMDMDWAYARYTVRLLGEVQYTWRLHLRRERQWL